MKAESDDASRLSFPSWGEWIAATVVLVFVSWLAAFPGLQPGTSVGTAGTYTSTDRLYGTAYAGITPPLALNDPSPSYLNYPYDQFDAEAFRQHQFPVWNPYNAAGVPLLAQAQSNPFNPLKLVYYLFPHSRGYDLFLLARLLVAGLGTFAFARILGLRFLSALVAALAFSYSGAVLGHFTLTDTHVYVILPLLLLALETLARRPQPSSALLGGLAAALVVLSGHLEVALLALAAGTVYYLARVAHLRRGGWRNIPAAFLAVLTFLGVVALPLLCFRELLSVGSGYSQLAPGKTTWAVHAQIAAWPFLMHLLFPTALPMRANNAGLGGLASVLALVGFFSCGWRRFPALIVLCVYCFILLFILPFGGVFVFVPANVYAHYGIASFALATAVFAGLGIEKLSGLDRHARDWPWHRLLFASGLIIAGVIFTISLAFAPEGGKIAVGSVLQDGWPAPISWSAQQVVPGSPLWQVKLFRLGYNQRGMLNTETHTFSVDEYGWYIEKIPTLTLTEKDVYFRRPNTVGTLQQFHARLFPNPNPGVRPVHGAALFLVLLVAWLSVECAQQWRRRRRSPSILAAIALVTVIFLSLTSVYMIKVYLHGSSVVYQGSAGGDGSDGGQQDWLATLTSDKRGTMKFNMAGSTTYATQTLVFTGAQGVLSVPGKPDRAVSEATRTTRTLRFKVGNEAYEGYLISPGEQFLLPDRAFWFNLGMPLLGLAVVWGLVLLHRVAWIAPLGVCFVAVIGIAFANTSMPAFRSDEPPASPAVTWLQQQTTMGDRVISRATIIPDTNMLAKLSIEALIEVFMPSRYRAFMGAWSGSSGLAQNHLYATKYSPSYFNLMGATYLVGLSGQSPADVLSSSNPKDPLAQFPIVYQDNHVVIFRNPFAFPRAFIAHSARYFAPGAPDVFTALGEPAFDPRSTLLLETPNAAPVGEVRDPPPGVAETAQITQNDATHVQIATSAQAPGYLFLSDTFYPGWVALVDGVKTPIYAADGMFRAIALPAGAHQVVFAYESPTVRASYALTMATLCGVILFVCWRYRPRRAGQKPNRSIAVDALVFVLAATMLATIAGFGLPG